MAEYHDEIINSLISQNEVLKGEIERLRGERDDVEALHKRKLIVHRPNDDHDVICNECDKPWPCRTYVLLHPEEARRG